MDEKKRVPKRRFDGFSEEWEERKFEDLLNQHDGIRRGPFGSALKKEFFVKESDYVVYEQHNAIYDNYDTRYNITKEKFEELKNFQLNEGDFILSGAGTIGKISRVPKGIKPGVFNQALVRIKIDTNVMDSEYFLQWIRSDNMQRKLTDSNPGSAMVNLVPMSEVKNWDVLIPSIPEQQKIGNFFKKLDEVISLQQRKLEKTKSLKSAYLAEMFPAEGERVPKRRFAGFMNDWVQQKVKNLSEKTFGGGTPKTSIVEYWNGDIPWIQSSDIQEHQVSGVIVNKRISEEGIKNSATKLVPENSIAIVTRVGVGKVALIPFKYTTSQDFLSLSDVNVDKWFAVYSLYRILQKEINSVQGTSIKGITKDELLNKQISIPNNLEEQQKIGNFFKQLDDKISIEQRKLDKLKALKQAYLHEMFV